jgi:hypothetical protein
MKTWDEDVEGFSQHLYISKKVQYLFSEGVKSTLYRDHSDRCFGFLTTLMVSMIEPLLSVLLTVRSYIRGIKITTNILTKKLVVALSLLGIDGGTN